MIKAVVLIAILVGVMALLGWLSISNNASQTTIMIDKNKVQQDAGKAVQKAKDFAEGVEDKVDDAAQYGEPITRWPSVP
jgi:beta-lactam-binding protein with PASTA domain